MGKGREVHLSEEDWHYVNDLIARRANKSVDEVILDALRRMRQRDAGERLARAVEAPKDGDYRHALVPPDGGVP